ncbi:MAG: hypothetical protein Q8S57_05815 [Methanoregula sp.]|nr:hypothetical protein [Methanoregula sp.]
MKVSNELNHPIRQLRDGVQKMGMVFFINPEPCRDVPEPCWNDLNYSAAVLKKGFNFSHRINDELFLIMPRCAAIMPR